MKKYKVKDKEELKEIIKKADINADLNYLDTSDISDMSFMFRNSKFNGDISKWNTSKATNMNYMFSGLKVKMNPNNLKLYKENIKNKYFAEPQYKNEDIPKILKKIDKLGNLSVFL